MDGQMLRERKCELEKQIRDKTKELQEIQVVIDGANMRTLITQIEDACGTNSANIIDHMSQSGLVPQTYHSEYPFK